MQSARAVCSLGSRQRSNILLRQMFQPKTMRTNYRLVSSYASARCARAHTPFPLARFVPHGCLPVRLLSLFYMLFFFSLLPSVHFTWFGRSNAHGVIARLTHARRTVVSSAASSAINLLFMQMRIVAARYLDADAPVTGSQITFLQ